MTTVESILAQTPGVENVMAIGGQSLVTATVAASTGTVLGRSGWRGCRRFDLEEMIWHLGRRR
jgi:hypothetical protein